MDFVTVTTNAVPGRPAYWRKNRYRQDDYELIKSLVHEGVEDPCAVDVPQAAAHINDAGLWTTFTPRSPIQMASIP